MKPLAKLNADQHGNEPMILELIHQSVNELSLAQTPCARVRIQDQIVDVLATRIRGLVEGHGGVIGTGAHSKVQRLDPMVASGQGLFEEILPMRQHEVVSIRELLCNLKTALLVATNMTEIPWELLHDGTDFFGLRYEMGRSFRTSGPEWRPRDKNDGWQCLIIANPTGDLPTASSEAAAVKESLEAKGIACDYLAEEEATFKNVLDCLSVSHYDIIHYSGHIARDDDSGEFGFVLRDSQFFTASSIKKHVRTPSIAFLNGCNSGEVVQGLTEAFLATGAQLVIGSLYATPSRGAAAFAKKFYTDFLNGVTAGEAMRQARLHVKGLEDCGISWACFVLYGDPRFSLDLKVDGLDTWLANAGFSRAEFDDSASKVLRQTMAYGAISGGVSTAIFFAALVEGTESFLRQQLERHGVLELLQGAFKTALMASETGEDGGSSGESVATKEKKNEIELSPHVQGILRRAKEVCLEKKMPKITELALVCGFAREAQGGAWTILRELKITPANLDPWRDANEKRKVSSVGSFTPAMCSEQFWSILAGAAERGYQTGAGGVSAVHLFQAMTDHPSRLLMGAFQRLGIKLSLDSGGSPGAFRSLIYDAAGEQILCSLNVNDILSRAKIEAEAGSRKVEEQDLLRAFIANGGGGAGELLLRHGIPLRMLTSKLFLEGGVVDTGRFDESGQKVLDETLDFARQRGYSTVGSRHLLYGLLSASEYFALELRRQDRDAEVLAEAFYVSVPMGDQRSASEMLRWPSISTSLLKILLGAEEISESEGAETICDKHLLKAWCLDDGGDARIFLIHQGVKVRKLCK